MWDAGVIADSQFKGAGPVKEGISTATKPLLPQLAAAGYKPSDVTYFAMSHYHSDHTANANAFASSTWIVQKPERDVMFAATPTPIMAPATFSALKDAKTTVLENEDYDVFGDGSVVVMSTPGHTPGHQVLFVKTCEARTDRPRRRPLSLSRRAHDREDAVVRIQCGAIEGQPQPDRNLPEADRRAALDRTRHRHARQPCPRRRNTSNE
jgi:ribonuclease BN (tRNA processing enzyme)